MKQETEEQSATTKAVPAYVPYRSFRNFIDGLKQGIPSRIDRSVMASMSGALQSQLTAALRFLGLISPNGLPGEFLPKLVNSEGPERVRVLRDILHASYPFLFRGFDLKTATPRMVEEQFSAAGASGGTIAKCLSFFMAAAKEAEIPVSPHLKNARGTRTTRPGRRTNREASAQANGGNGLSAPVTTDASSMTWQQLLLSKFPSFDPAWPDDVKSKWFSAFDQLMKHGEKKD